MSKSVLVMDMPNECFDCPLHKIDNQGDLVCKSKRRFICLGMGETKPEWCPLRPLPERRSLSKYSIGTHVYRAEGWNDCLDEITGGRSNE